MIIIYIELSAAQSMHYSCQNENSDLEQTQQYHILQLCQQQRSFLREQSANRQSSSLSWNRTINHQSRHWPQARCQRNWRNSLSVNPARLQAASRSSLKHSHLNLNLNHFLMNLFMKSILRTKIRSVMKLKKFWKSPRNESKVLLKSLLVILAVLIHLAVLMNLITDSAKSILNIITVIMRWILTSTLTLTFH